MVWAQRLKPQLQHAPNTRCPPTVTDPDIKAAINDNALSTVDTVTNLVLHLRETQGGPIMLR